MAAQDRDALPRDVVELADALLARLSLRGLRGRVEIEWKAEHNDSDREPYIVTKLRSHEEFSRHELADFSGTS